jgi:hypothetical protein
MSVEPSQEFREAVGRNKEHVLRKVNMGDEKRGTFRQTMMVVEFSRE